MRTWGVFRMILHRKRLMLFMAHAFETAVVEVNVGDFHFSRIKTFGVDTETVVLRGDFDMSADKIFDRLIAAAVAELEFVGSPPVGKAKHLMTKADTENRKFPEQFL